MPSHDPPEHPLAHILEDAFAPQLESGEVDLMVNRMTQEFEIQADEWTLHLEGWPVTLAFVALDEEPSSATDRAAALDAALDNQSLAALRRANMLLDEVIVACLADSGDELSALLAGVIADTGGSDMLDSLQG